MVDFVKVGCRIAEHRKRLGMSQGELADRLFVTRQALSKWENGTGIPSVDTIVELCGIFSVSFEEMLFDEAPRDVDENDIFRGHDRSYIVSKIAEGKIKINIADVFYQMSPAERMYILKAIKDRRIFTDIEELSVKLTPSERKYMERNIYEIHKGSN